MSKKEVYQVFFYSKDKRRIAKRLASAQVWRWQSEPYAKVSDQTVILFKSDK